MNQQQPIHSTNVQEELHRVEMALSAVYSPTLSGEDRAQADRFLTEFQQTPTAWMVCDALLQKRGDLNFIFFAAQTLHTKCRHDVAQLPPESLPSLRDSLVASISDVSQSPVVRQRLSMAVACLAVQMEWCSIVTDILATQNSLLISNILLVLPEETASDRLLLRDENARYKMRDALVENSPLILQNAELGLKMWHAWIKHVPIPPQVIANSIVVDTTLQALHSPELFEVAIDTLVELLRMYPSHILHNYPLVNLLLPKLLALPMDTLLHSDDEDVVRGYCRCITELGESYISLLMETPRLDIVDRLLKCTAVQDTDIASMTLQFWFRFTMDLENIPSLRKRQDLVDAYTPHLLELLRGLIKHLQYPADVDTMSPDRLDDLHRDRFYIGDTLQDLCRLLGGQAVLDTIASQLSFQNQTEWQQVEACLFAIQAIHDYIPQDEGHYMPHVFDLVSSQQLPADCMPLRYTACMLIGKYASWLAFHSDKLQPLLPFLAESLKLPKCARAASIAIKELCECISLGESMLDLYNSVQVELCDELQLLQGVCATISREDNPASYVGRILEPLGTKWQADLSNNASTVKSICAQVERLTVVIRHLRMGGPALLQVIQSSWSLLDASTQKFPRDFRLAESVCRLHKHALRTCTAPVYAQMFDAFTKMCVESFERSHQSPYLYAASIVICEYGRDAAYTSRLMEMVSALAATAFGFLTSLEQFILHPDVVEELFYCMGRMMNYCSAPLMASPLLPSLIQCALVGMQLDHRDANRGTLNFLEAAVGNLNPQNGLSIVQSLGMETVVAQLMQALVGELPAYSIEGGSGSIAGILWKLHLVCPQLLKQWMTTALQGRAPPQDVQDLIQSLSCGVRDEFDASVRAFRSSSERHRKMAQGASSQ